MSIRFALGYAGGLQSCLWKLCTQGDEAYLLQGGVTSKHQKFSFHKSGNCRWARIEPGVSGPIASCSNGSATQCRQRARGKPPVFCRLLFRQITFQRRELPNETNSVD